MSEDNAPEQGVMTTRRRVLMALMATVAIVAMPIVAHAAMTTADTPIAASFVPRTFTLNEMLKPSNVAYLWATEALPSDHGWEKALQNLIALHAEDWRFVSIGRHPEMRGVPNPFGGSTAIVRAAGGAVLMERPLVIHEAAERAKQERLETWNREYGIRPQHIGDDDEVFGRMRADAPRWAKVTTFRPIQHTGPWLKGGNVA